MAELRVLIEGLDKYSRHFKSYVTHGQAAKAESEAFQLYQIIDEMLTFAHEGNH
jgi:hypothetical protein